MWLGVGAAPTVLHEHATSYKYLGLSKMFTMGDSADVGAHSIARSRTVRDYLASLRYRLAPVQSGESGARVHAI